MPTVHLPEQPTNPKKEKGSANPDIIVFSNFANLTEKDVVNVLQTHDALAYFDEDKREEATSKSAQLIMAMIDGMNRIYGSYEKRGLNFKRSTFEIHLSDRADVQKAMFYPKKNMIALAFSYVSSYVYKDLQGRAPTPFPDEINKLKLWGAGEAHHSIYSQFKGSSVVPNNLTEAQYYALDHEFRALEAKIRLAKQEGMPPETIDEKTVQLEKAKAERAKKTH